MLYNLVVKQMLMFIGFAPFLVMTKHVYHLSRMPFLAQQLNAELSPREALLQD